MVRPRPRAAVSDARDCSRARTAWGLARFLQSLLFETNPHDPLIYGVVAIGLLGVAALACWLPARHAMKVDPLVALRAE